MRETGRTLIPERRFSDSDHLEVAPGAALLMIQRICYTHADRLVYFQERFYRPDRVQYRVTLGRHDMAVGGAKIDEFRAVFEQQA